MIKSGDRLDPAQSHFAFRYDDKDLAAPYGVAVAMDGAGGISHTHTITLAGTAYPTPVPASAPSNPVWVSPAGAAAVLGELLQKPAVQTAPKPKVEDEPDPWGRRVMIAGDEIEEMPIIVMPRCVRRPPRDDDGGDGND